MLKNHRSFCFVAILTVFFVIAIAASSASAQQRFVAQFTGAQETPPSGSTAVGYGVVTLNAAETSITVDAGFSGLGTAASAGHIHTAPVGVGGPVTFGFTGVPAVITGTIPQQTFAISPAQVIDLKAGNMYFNIHTGGFLGGEIRGQILGGSCATAGPIEVEATAGTVGPTAYGTLAAAIAAINAGTHQGTIGVEVCASTTEAAAMFLNSNTAAPASYSSIYISPVADGLTISGPTVTGRGLIELNGADNVTIDGDNQNTAGTNRNLTITNTAVSTTTLTSVIRVAVVAAVPTADNITIRNLNLNGSATGRNISTATSTTGSENNTFVIYAGGVATGATTAPGPLTSVTSNTALAGTTINTFNVTNNAVNQAARGIVFNGAAATISTGVTIANNLVGDQGTVSGTPPITTPTTTVYTKGMFIVGTTALSITGNSVKSILSYVGTTMAGIELNGAIGAGAITISNNTVNGVINNGTGSGARGIDISSASTALFTAAGNTISNVQSVGSVTITGFRFSTAATAGTIEKNMVSGVNSRGASTFGAYGMSIEAGSNLTIKNNFISDVQHNMTGGSSFSTTFGVFGLRIAGGTGHSIHNNSVNLFAAYLGTPNLNLLSAAFAIVGTGQTGIDVRNNIFVNTTTGGTTGIAHVAVYLPISGTTAMNLTMNNNDYFSGSTAGVHGVAHVGTTYTAVPAGPATWAGLYTLAAFDPTMTTPTANFRAYTSTLLVANTNNDNASIKTDPLFVSTTDLHLQAGSLARDVGAIIAAVTNDIDMQLRPGGNALYDIGADEFDGTTPPANDLQATAFIDPTNGGLKITGVAFSPQASFTNNGTATQTAVTVRYRICTDGTCTTEVYNNTAVIASIAPSATANVTFPSTSIAVAGTYTTKARSELGTDTVPANDEITGTVILQDPLAGTYTVGSGGNYPSLTNNGGIFEAINSLGASGNITIEILSNLSGELGTHPLNEIAGGFSTTMYPCSNPITITGSNAGALIRLNGADNVTINGDSDACGPPAVVGGTPASRHLTITNTNTGTSAVVISVGSNATNGAQNNTIQNVRILGQDPTTTLIGISMGGATPGTVATGPNNNNRVENCLVGRALFGIYSAGLSAASPNTGTVITMNETSAVVGDRIRRVGIVVFNENGVQITENSINGVSTNESADGIGIGVGTQGVDNTTTTGGGVLNALVARNKINGISSLSAVGFSAAGITVAGATGGANTIQNNMITGVTAPATSPDIVAGIFVVGATGSNTRLYHNSIAMTGDRGAVATQMPSYGIAITGADPTVELKNNIFYTTQIASGGGVNAESYTIGMVTTTFVNLDSNYNDFFASGANAGFFRSGSLTTAAGTDYGTLAAWQTAVSDDANSQEVDPIFINPANDLHLNGLTPTPLLGDGLTGFATVDHDNDPRPAANPEIGADELVQSTTGVFPAGIFYNAISAPGDQMAGSATITNSMTLNGILNTGNFNVLTMGCDATFANAGGGNYVVGTVNKQYCSAGAFVYPVGTTPDNALSGGKENDNGVAPPEFTPVSVTVTAGTFPSFLSARVFDATLVGFDPANSLSRNWELTELGDITADLTFTYLDGAITDVNGTEASYITYRRNANGTTDPMCVALCVDTVNNMLTGVTGVTQFSRWSGAALVPTAAGVDVSGRVLTPNGGGLRNAIVTLTDTRGVTRTARSTTFGYYRFEDVRVGETYVINVNSKLYIFTPRTVQVFDAVTGLDMTADGEQ